MSSLIERLKKDARKAQKTVALPESSDPRVWRAAHVLLSEQLVSRLFLWLSRKESLVLEKQTNLSLAPFGEKVVWVKDTYPSLQADLKTFHQDYMEGKKKAVTPEALAAYSQLPLNQAGLLLRQNVVDSVIAGCASPTADVIRAALTTIGLAPGIKTISGSFLMHRLCPGDIEQNYIYADSGVVIEPTKEQLVDIAASSAETYERLFPNSQPHVAFLSFSTKGSADHPNAQKMAEACQMFRQRFPKIVADGEIQFDAAFDAAIGLRKCPDSKLPGNANIFIFPNLDAGNIAYKITQRLAGFSAFGPILQGTAKPYSDLSRGASADDIVMMTCINILK